MKMPPQGPPPSREGRRSLRCHAFACLGLTLLALAPVQAVQYSAVARAALLDFKNKLGPSASWSSSWIAANPCTSWDYTVCNPVTGDLLQLNLANFGIRGVIPDSFYTITTLEKLNLRNNQFYGTINRRLADINQNLYYLDLSANLFTGNYPDVWTNPDMGSAADWPYQLTINSNNVYFNISYTYFGGLQTYWTSAFAATGYPWLCVGIHGDFAGGAEQTCMSFRTETYNAQTIGACGSQVPVPRGYVTPEARPLEECLKMCGSGTNLRSKDVRVCNSREGMVCVPNFSGSTVNGGTCQVSGTTVSSASSISVSTVGNVLTSQAASLSRISAALGNPPALSSFTSSPVSCNSIATAGVAGCDASRNIISLDLKNLNLRAEIPAAISELTFLRRLVLSNNGFFGKWPFTLTAVLPQLEHLDVSRNFLTGDLPTDFTTKPTFLNFSNNYFTGDPTVSFFAFTYNSDPTINQDYVIGLGFARETYCPRSNSDPITGSNCLSNYANSPCPGDAQRTAAECLSFCSVTMLPSLTGADPVKACYGVANAKCVPSVSSPPTFSCSPSVSPPSSAVVSSVKPVFETQLLFFKDQYVKKYKTPAAVFASWKKNAPCNTWSGLTCDEDGFLIAVNLRGVGLVGPFPGPTTFQNLFWNYEGKPSFVKYLDLSNNRLYGVVDPKLSLVYDLEYLDVSGNFLSGSVPSFIYGNYKFLNFENNFLVGSSSIRAMDSSSAICGGVNFQGIFTRNCFDLPVVSGFNCPRITAKSKSACKRYCPGGASSRKKACTKRGTTCKPVRTRLTCTK